MAKGSKFEIHLIAPVALVGDIVELMDGEGVVVAIKPYDESKPTRKSYVGGKKNKGISSENAVMNILKESSKALNSIQIGKLMSSKYKFAESSAPPALSRLVAAKKVIRNNNLFTLAK